LSSEPSKSGVCIFVKKDISYNSVDVVKHCEEKNLEICTIQIELMTNQLIIICVYRASCGDFHQFLRLLDLILLSVYKPKTEFVICGDINVNYLSFSDRKLQLSQLLGTYNMIHTVNFPTRFKSS
jgi:exonuclease III